MSRFPNSMERKAEADIRAMKEEEIKTDAAYKAWHEWYYQSSDQPPTSYEAFRAGWTAHKHAGKI